MRKNSFVTIVFIIFFLLQGCGYKPVYSSKNLDINFKNIEFTKTKLNNQIVNSLESFSNPKSENIFNLKLDAKNIVRTITKDSKGNPETFEISTILKFNISNETKNLSKTFTGRINFSNNDNKFELSLYEKELEDQIINDILEDVLMFLTNIK